MTLTIYVRAVVIDSASVFVSAGYNCTKCVGTHF